MSRIEQTQKLIYTFINDEPIWRTWWTSTFWWRTQQHYDVYL